MLLVTDVMGHVGRAVLTELAGQPIAVRAILPPGSHLPVQAENIQGIQGELDDTRMLSQAFQGVEAAFVATAVSPQMTETHLRLISVGKDAGVRRLVQITGVGANATMCCARVLRWFGQAETHAEMSGLAVTHLQPTNLLQNLLEFAPAIAQHGAFAGPFRSTKWTWVDARDVGAVAAVVLKDPSHVGKTYTVTGTEALTYQEIAERLGGVIGKPIKFSDITANEARGWLQAKGLSPVMIEAKLELWDACASQLINAAPTSVVKDLTGHEPRSVEDFVRDYRGQFGG